MAISGSSADPGTGEANPELNLHVEIKAVNGRGTRLHQRQKVATGGGGRNSYPELAELLKLDCWRMCCMGPRGPRKPEAPGPEAPVVMSPPGGRTRDTWMGVAKVGPGSAPMGAPPTTPAPMGCCWSCCCCRSACSCFHWRSCSVSTTRRWTGIGFSLSYWATTTNNQSVTMATCALNNLSVPKKNNL